MSGDQQGMMRERRRPERRAGRRLAPALLLTLAAPGCYHAGNDTLARAAQSSFQEASAVASLDEERKESRSLLARELDAVRRETEAERDLMLASVLDGTWRGAASSELAAAPPAAAPAKPVRRGARPAPPANAPPAPAAPPPAVVPCDVPGTDGMVAGSFLCAINRQLVRLGGAPPAGSTPLSSLRELRARAARLVADTESILLADERSVRLLVPSGTTTIACPEEGEPEGVRALLEERPALRPLLDAYAATCRRVQKARSELAALPAEGGLLAAAQKEVSARKALLERQRGEAAKLAGGYDKARKACDEAKAKGTLRGELDDLRGALEKLSGAASAVASAASGLGANRYAQLAELERRHQGLMEIIDAGLDGKGDGGALGVFIRSATEIDEIRHDPSLLLLEAERLRGEVAVLRVQIAHMEQQLTLLDTRRKALVDQLGELIAAGDDAERAMRACRAGAGAGVADTFARSRDRGCRDAVAGALLHYANAWTVGEVRARVAGRRADEDMHEQGIEAQAAVMRTWERVLAVPIDAVVRKHAAGIKPGELARLLIEAVGVGALIGIAVPK